MKQWFSRNTNLLIKVLFEKLFFSWKRGHAAVQEILLSDFAFLLKLSEYSYSNLSFCASYIIEYALLHLKFKRKCLLQHFCALFLLLNIPKNSDFKNSSSFPQKMTFVLKGETVRLQWVNNQWFLCLLGYLLK